MTLLDHIIKQAQFETEEKEKRSEWLEDYYKDLKPNEQQVVDEVGCGSLETTSQGRKTQDFQYIKTRKKDGFMVI